MACELYRTQLVGLLYDDIDAAERAELTAHLATCASCRDGLAALGATRAALRDGAPSVPHAPRVVVLARRRALARAWLAFAAGITVALVAAGAGAAGFAYASRTAPAPADTAALVEREVERRWQALEASLAAARAAAPSPAPVPEGVTKRDLDDAMERLEHRIDGSRASDLDYVQDLIAASERRTGSWIGETQKALRYVALANDPGLSER